MKEAPYKLVRPFCNAKGQSKAGQEHRKTLTDRVQRHQAGQKASKKEGYRKQNQAKKDASCKEGRSFSGTIPMPTGMVKVTVQPRVAATRMPA